MKSKKKIRGIQSCRAIAALSVLLYHVGTTASAYHHESYFNLLFSLGHLGVDFFFVLSGFIIFNAHFGDIGDRQKGLLYAKKRFFRIYPIFFIITSSKVLIFLMLGTEFREEQKSVSYFLSSYLLFPIKEQFPLVNVAWTLSHEIIFYFYFLVAMLMGRRAFYFMTSVWALCILYYNLIDHDYNFALFYILSTYNLEFIIGMFVALIYRQTTINPRYTLAGVAIFLSAFIYFGSVLSDLGLRFIFGSGFGLLVLASTSLPEFKGAILRKVEELLYLTGNASYSIYLVHTLVITAIYKALINSMDANFLGFVTLFVSLGTGILFWKFVENPLFQFTRKKFINK